MKLFSFLLIFVLAAQCFAMGQARPPVPVPAPNPVDEPGYCTYEGLRQFEKKDTTNKLSRLHVYQLGRVTIAGLAVGNSNAQDVMRLAATYSNASQNEKFCTWYINDGNSEAERAFNWKYVPRPDNPKDVDTYMKALGPYFHQANNNIVKCALENQYLALGCDGMKHRGPTFFGMILAYSGCSPESANATINKIWGVNGVDEIVRLTIIQKAHELGLANPQFSAALYHEFTSPQF